MQLPLFRFADWSYDRTNRQFQFRYQHQRDEAVLTFEERLQLPEYDQTLLTEKLVSIFGRQLHLMLGISYWKMFCPETIEHPYQLTAEEAAFWQLLYTEGLGEFYYTNQIDFRRFQLFTPAESPPSLDPVTIEVTQMPIVGIGGGKDSLVSIELLKRAERPWYGFVVEHARQQTHLGELLQVIGNDTLRFQRQIDSQLKTVPGQYRGHVPVSAIYGLIGVLAAVLKRADAVLVSNEATANIGNTTYLGKEINHQWSKTVRFEMAFRSLVHQVITPSITYASILRPLSEYRIAKEFATMTQYHHTFSSCNRNFRSGHEKTQRLSWCGECPKCAFSYALLSAFLSREDLEKIFGQNLLDKDDLLPLFQELWGETPVKPFDCVGTPEEVVVSLAHAVESGQYQSSPILQYFAQKILPDYPHWQELEQNLMRLESRSPIPEGYREVIETLR